MIAVEDASGADWGSGPCVFSIDRRHDADWVFVLCVSAQRSVWCDRSSAAELQQHQQPEQPADQLHGEVNTHTHTLTAKIHW